MRESMDATSETAEGGRMNKCDKCEYFKDVFGNFVQCIKTGRFIDYEYWNNQEPEDCPTKDAPLKEEE